MGIRKRTRIRYRQRLKRHKRRLKLSQKGLDPKKFFYGKYYVGQK